MGTETESSLNESSSKVATEKNAAAEQPQSAGDSAPRNKSDQNETTGNGARHEVAPGQEETLAGERTDQADRPDAKRDVAAPTDAGRDDPDGAAAPPSEAETPLNESVTTEQQAVQAADVESSPGETEAPPSTSPSAAKPSTAGKPPLSSKAKSRDKKKSNAKQTMKEAAARSRKEAKQKKRERKIDSFKDYFNHREPLSKVPAHRFLALSRGERSKILRVKIETELEPLLAKAEETLVPADHPHAEFLRGCVRDALVRLILPSLERDVRREMTERAENKAVEVFARNLRKLLLQPPVRNLRVLAIDPGFRSGCKIAALDEFGNVLGHTVIHVIGKEEVVRKGREQIVEMVRMYRIPAIAIGNGTACRETEKLVAKIIAEDLRDLDVKYAIVNEAGASVYSTSPLGREELGSFDPLLRSAVSIGRRLQDPLSELVKINPANIGVGMYQHDVKAKHLQHSLDAVVESCVNFVGVDVNSASPSLLRYVSGLNQLTARRIYDYRRQHGPFRNREQLKQVPGFGDAAFVQAAGFLKIADSDNPLDATWIHPESYDVARRVIEKIGGTIDELAVPSKRRAAKAEQTADTTGEAHETAAAGESDDAAKNETAAAESPASDDGAQASVAEQSHEVEAEAESAAIDTAAATTTGEPSMETAAPIENETTASETPIQETPAEESRAPDSVESQPAAAQADIADAPTAEKAVAEEHAEQPAAAAEPSTETPTAEPAKAKLAERVAKADVPALASDLGVGELLLSDILNSLTRPGRDPREDLTPPMFRSEVMKLEDLEPGMELTGTVLNVVDFGAFVDIGLPDSGLIHISRLADRFVRDPHEVISVGDILSVWIVDVDKQRRRVSLTAIEPGTEKSQEQRAQRPPRESRGDRPPRKPRGERSGGGRPGGEKSGRRPQSGRSEGRPKKPPKPKPVKPITEAMVEGKEPLRSFSDLLQFYERKSDDDDDNQKKKKSK